MGEFARCCFESLSLAYWSALEALRSLTGREIRTLRVVGGGCLNTFLCQMTADACGCSVVSGPAEASALGNVMVLPSMADIVRGVDAHDGSEIWQVTLGTPITGSQSIDSHQINQYWGCLSTGVIDADTQRQN